MIWYVILCWLAVSFSLTAALHLMRYISSPEWLCKLIGIAWLSSLAILYVLVLWATWLVLLAPVVKLFALEMSLGL